VPDGVIDWAGLSMRLDGPKVGQMATRGARPPRSGPLSFEQRDLRTYRRRM